MSLTRGLVFFPPLKNNGESVLREAIKSKDVATIQSLLQLGADPNGTYKSKHYENEPFLLKAVKEQNTPLITSLIKSGARINNAIIIAYINFHFYRAYSQETYQRIIKILLDWASGVNFYNSPLNLKLTKFRGIYPGGLCFLNNLNITGFNFVGVAKGGKPITLSDISKYPGYETALLTFNDIKKITDPERRKLLSKHVREAIIKNGLLIRNGILNLVPLHRAVEIGDIETVKIRLAANVNINDPTHMPPIFLAAVNEHFDIMKLLLAQNNIELNGIILALKALLQKNNFMDLKENIILLIEQAKTIAETQKTCWYGELMFFILDYFYNSPLKEDEKIFQIISLWSFLKKHGANFNVKNYNGEPLLNLCIKYQSETKNVDLIVYLLENNYNFRMTNNKKNGPLYVAAQCNFAAATQLLLQAGIGTPNIIEQSQCESFKKSHSDSQLLQKNLGFFISNLIQERKIALAKKQDEANALTASLSPRSKIYH